MVICGVIVLLLTGMAVLAATDPDRRRDRSGITLDTQYSIRPVTERPRQPATPTRAPDRGTAVIRTPGMPGWYDPPSASARRPYTPPVPTQASKVHDRHHCPGCMCGQ